MADYVIGKDNAHSEWIENHNFDVFYCMDNDIILKALLKEADTKGWDDQHMLSIAVRFIQIILNNSPSQYKEKMLDNWIVYLENTISKEKIDKMESGQLN